MRAKHKQAHPECPHPNWGACDKDRDAVKADWDAMQQVLLAWKIAQSGRTKPYRKEKDIFSQLVRVIAGEQADLTNDEGNPAQTPWALRLRAAMQRAMAGDLPRYNLYDLTPAVPAQAQEGT